MKRACAGAALLLLTQQAQQGLAGNLRGGAESSSLQDTYDVIVIGGGLTGSIVAAKLSEQRPDKRVLLLEAGEPSQKVLGGTQRPASVHRGWWQDWPGDWKGLTRYDVPGNYGVLNCWSPGCSQETFPDLPAYQCKILGGCGVMNGALGQIPRPNNFESWPQGWQHANVSAYLERAREMFHYTATPSSNGIHYLNDTGASIVQDAFSKGGFVDGDAMYPRKGMMGEPKVAAKHGVRVSSTSELIPDALRRENFALRVQAPVSEILHDSHGTATGVRLQDGEVLSLSSPETGRVILTAGAWNTPRLLLASRLGNSAVGKGISDHTHHGGTFERRDRWGPQARPFTYSPPPAEAVEEYVAPEGNVTFSGIGPLAQFGPTFVAYIKDPSTPGGEDGDFDVEVWVAPSPSNDKLSMGMALMRPTCSSADIVLSGGRVRSYGCVHDCCERDRRITDYAKDIVSKYLAKFGYFGGFGGGNAMNHWAGSCKLGSCVDPDSLIVRETTNVAVADASILPMQVWAHPSLTLQALALKAADMFTDQIEVSV